MGRVLYITAIILLEFLDAESAEKAKSLLMFMGIDCKAHGLC